jgi:HK97 family phage major capsid protein
MGKIKELREKVAAKTATDEEKAELAELEAEAAEGAEGTEGGTEAEIDKLADALVAKAEAAFDAKAAELEAKFKPESIKKDEVGFIVDKQLGKITVEELETKMVALPGRKAAGKSITEVSMKTVAWAQALMQGDRQKLQLLTEGTGTAGGYLVPEEFANMIVEDKRDLIVMRQLADSMTISGDTLHLPTLEGRPKASWRGEAAVKSTSTAQFNELVFTPYSLAVIVGLSQELADDASLGVGGSIVNYVARLMTRAIAEKEEEAFWTGNGSGKPTGITNYNVASIDAGSTDATLADAIKRVYWRLPQGYRNSAVWVAHQQAWERVNTVKDTVGQYLLTRLADSPTVMLQGRPVYEQNDLPTDQIFFGDFSYYMIVDRQGITVDFSTEATVAGSSAFEKNLVFVRVEERVDGELTLPAAVRRVVGLN